MNNYEVYFVKAETIAKIALKKIMDLYSQDPFGNGSQLCNAVSIAKEALVSMEELRKSYCGMGA